MLSIASYNGLQATERCFELLGKGAAALEACVEAIELVEDDPEELTVGYGGLPNELGEVELDAAVMDGRTHRGAGVAALRRIRRPTRVARLLMEQTERALLVGEGAYQFARANGFPDEDLLTERARRMWLYWKRTRSTRDDWRAPAEQEVDAETAAWFAKHYARTDGKGRGGTVHLSALDAAGDVACATSTSGHAFKLPGRVGDSPILGAGLYADNEVGACGSIGHGEANLENLSSYAAVELMRAGRSPQDAGLEVLRRVAAKTRPAQRDGEGRPNFNLQLFLLSRDGRYAGVAMRGPQRFSVSDPGGTRLEDSISLYHVGDDALHGKREAR